MTGWERARANALTALGCFAGSLHDGQLPATSCRSIIEIRWPEALIHRSGRNADPPYRIKAEALKEEFVAWNALASALSVCFNDRLHQIRKIELIQSGIRRHQQTFYAVRHESRPSISPGSLSRRRPGAGRATTTCARC